MTTENTVESVRPSSRFTVCEAGSVQLSVERAPGLRPTEADATLLDISPYGAKLLAASRLEIHELITLQVSVPEIKRTLAFPAIVRWRQPVDDVSWRFGCVFTGQLPEDVLTELSQLGYIERRQDPRQPVDLIARARWELAEEDIAVRIVNVSAGGLRLKCGQRGRLGERLVLELGSGESPRVSVHARAVWEREADGQWLIGCRLASRADQELLRGTLRLAVADGEADADSPRWRPILGIAVLIALAVIPLAVYLLWG